MVGNLSGGTATDMSGSQQRGGNVGLVPRGRLPHLPSTIHKLAKTIGDTDSGHALMVIRENYYRGFVKT